MSDLEVDDLTVEFASGGYIVRPIDSLTFSADAGELIILLGPSGSGKTTLLSCLAGILTPKSGSIQFGDLEVTRLTGPALTNYRKQEVGIVFQAFNLIPSLSALENVAVSIGGATGRVRARELLTEVGLEDRTHHRPGQLSGGQQQRVAIARALAFDPPMLLADEPTAHLDYIQVEGVLRLIRDLASRGRLVLVATHDQRIVPLADRVVELAPRYADADPKGGPQPFELQEGQVLFEQGSRGELIFILKEGEIELNRTRADGSEEHLTTIGLGEYFGELAPLLGFPRSATARASVRSVVVGYSIRDFRDLVGEDRIAEVLGERRGDQTL